ncbi:sugar ABC transporter ATP-binding protein [Arthrobacter globiformis]|uniref:sugar ABC transporter ATP-binding protein n=1 Tax=Arthrobacter globiformis TaxID=1665 RepID=UPI00278A356B|nr:sugar ABC transporter ATP-binding protein [Arthrobacter globiformis]MDQ0867489.1 monosaccharide-transporting ATPase [Arthrobacter globiformis]
MPVRELQPVLEARSIRKSFNGVHALKDASLKLYPGEVHGLNGENGAGKSTLIKIITGFHQPDGGQLLLNGDQVSFSKPRDSQNAGISTVYQEVNLIPERTVAENIFLGREPRRGMLLDRRSTLEQAADILRRYDLRIDPRAKLSTLGLGIQQMIAIVRAVAVNAKVVILDEPTSALNGTETEILFSMIRTLRAEGAAILFVSHRMSELYDLCDRFTVLRDGRFIAESSPSRMPRTELINAMLGGVKLDEQRRDRHEAKARTERLAQAPVALSVRNLHWSTRVQDVSFDIHEGEILGLLGLLGSGRTETCKAIFGAARAEKGEVLVHGRPLTKATPARALQAGIAYLSEDRKTEGIFPGLSVKENMTAAMLRRISPFGFVRAAEQDNTLRKYSAELKIKAADPDQAASELSGGNQQKVLLARWLSLAPKVVLLDDPTRGIDVGAKAEVHRVIRALADDGIAVLLTSSETEELLALSDRMIVLSEGHVTGQVHPHDVEYEDLLSLMSGQNADVGNPSGPGTADDKNSAAIGGKP